MRAIRQDLEFVRARPGPGKRPGLEARAVTTTTWLPRVSRMDAEPLE